MNPLHKKLLRTLFEGWGQSLAVIAVVACGIAAYVCVYSAYLNLKLTRDTYYAQYRFADFELMLDRAPETAINLVEGMPGVRSAYGRIVDDVSVDIAGLDEPRSGRIVSLPVPRRDVLNDILVTRGRFFDGAAKNQAILSERFAIANKLNIGDIVQVSIDEKKYPLQVVGFGLSPEYVYMIRNAQEFVPAPETFGVVWVPEDFARNALGMQAACNNIVGYLDDPRAVEAFFDLAEDRLESFGLFAKVKKDDQISNRFLSDEIKGLAVNATITPTLFMSIAALILLILLNRMVRLERNQIGLLKAFGYSDTAIAWHYLEYALILSLTGCLVGALAGQWLAGLIIGVYVQFYQFPILINRFYPEVLARSVALCAGFGLAGAASAARAASRIHPAEAMRPQAPPSGHRLLLERIPFLWAALSFTWKMITRNIARNQWHAAFTVFGVAISTSLMLVGLYSTDAMNFMLRFQFENVQREDARVGFHREHPAAAMHEIENLPSVRRTEGILEYPFRLRSAHREKETAITGLAPDGELRMLLDEAGHSVPIYGDGIILTERLARDLDVQPGDILYAEDLTGRVDGERALPVSRIIQQYLGMGAYMDLHALSRLLNSPPMVNAALLRIDESEGPVIKRELKDVAAVSAVTFNKEAYQAMLDTLAASMGISNTIMLVFAGVIAFAIIYNLASVALAERQRELASLRVLGLSHRETAAILFNESIVLSALGIVLGIPLGIGLCKLLIRAYDTELFRLPFHIEPSSYATAVLTAAFFVLLANAAIWRKLGRLDLVEVLKERE